MHSSHKLVEFYPSKQRITEKSGQTAGWTLVGGQLAVRNYGGGVDGDWRNSIPASHKVI